MLASTTLVAVATCKLAIAQSIQTDGTTTTRPESCSGDCTITDGLQQGNNLFHSFERFNVDSGARVLFEDSGVTNILGRVTGNEVSEILGTLGVTGGDANLFLINPNGIIFGKNSSLNVNGSFLATTADAVRFGEQGLFETSDNQIPLLTVNPSALVFVDGNRGNIVNRSSEISSLVDSSAGEGGDIILKAQAILAYDDSDIFASAVRGRGGNIVLDTPAFFGERFIGANSDSNIDRERLQNNNRVDIDATGTVNGVVTLPNISFIQQDLEQLPTETIDTENLLATSCIARDESGGSFIVTGRGGLPTRPQDAATAFFDTGTIQTLASDSAVNPNDNNQRQVNNPIVEPTGVYRLPNGQLIISHECQ